MEHLEGSDRARTSARGAMPVDEAVDLHPSGLRGGRRGAHARHRPPRPQAGESVPHPRQGRSAASEGARLRHLEGRGRGRHVERESARHPALHVPRAGRRLSPGRRALRRVVARRRPLRDAHREASLRGLDSVGHLRRHQERATSQAQRPSRRHPPASRGRRRARARPRARPPLRERRGACRVNRPVRDEGRRRVSSPDPARRRARELGRRPKCSPRCIRRPAGTRPP